MAKKVIFGIHTAPDLDTFATLTLLQEYDPSIKGKEAAFLFLSTGDEVLTPFNNLILIDRGRGEFDHHQRPESGETSASIVAKKLGIAENLYISQLLGLVKRSDLQGISLPFDLSHITKCMQRSKELTDEEKVKVGTRIVMDTIKFRENSLSRDNLWVKELITDFLANKEIVPKIFQKYLWKLTNPKFERLFDLVEILVNERRLSEEEAKSFGRKILQIVYDEAMNFFEAQKEVERTTKIYVNGMLIIAGINDNPGFNIAARAKGAGVVVQQNTDGRYQIFFNTEKVEEKIIDSLISMIRLEECLIHNRQIPQADLRKPERIKEIPEWYYFKPSQIGRKKPGRFLLNGSLTAKDTPTSKIPLKTLLYLVECSIRFRNRFNWPQWKDRRLSFYGKRGG